MRTQTERKKQIIDDENVDDDEEFEDLLSNNITDR